MQIRRVEEILHETRQNMKKGKKNSKNEVSNSYVFRKSLL